VHGHVLSRGRFLGLAGSALATAALPRTARAAPSAPAVVSFPSRPDLEPPGVQVTAPALGTAAGLVFTATSAGPGSRGPLILDDRGEVVWFRPLAQRTAMDFRVQRFRGEPVLTWWEGTITGGYGAGEYVVADTSYRELRRVRAGNGYRGDLHEFLLTDRGTALLTIYAPAAADLTAAGGPAQGTLLESIVQEVDVVSGRVLFEWHARDHIDPTETFAAPGDGPFDHFHVNSIDVDTDGNLLVSARNTWTVYKLDRRSGEVIWRLGGKRSDFALGDGAGFSWQHDARRQPDGTITLFDDGAAPQEEPASRGIRVALDTAAMRATLVRDFVHPSGILAVAMGSMELLPDGGAFVGWGTDPSFSEFAPDGTLRFGARFVGGGESYRSYRLPWSGAPDTRPSLALTGAGRRMVAHASWNGATAVTRWRLLAGPTRGSVVPAGAVARAGFETELPVPPGAGYVAVSALDRAGRVLGTSAAVKI
jgi:hypothetical protein